MFLYAHFCAKFSNQSTCLDNRKCVSCWHRLLLPINTPFLSLSSTLVSGVAPTLLISPYVYLFSTALSSLPLPVVILEWYVFVAEFSTLRGPHNARFSKYLLRPNTTLSPFSEMLGYTLEMPGGMSFVRLFRRNLQMLKSVSGMWELKGSSYR